MQVILSKNRLVLLPENETDSATLRAWEQENLGHAFVAAHPGGEAHVMTSLGPREEACREPINITSRAADPTLRLISNFAPAPFTMDGRDYACVEAFWQGLKFETEAQRRRMAVMSGPEARRAGEEQGYGEHITYEGKTFTPGTWEHWALMERACRAKFTQNAEAAAALLATGQRPLEHKVRRDSRTIPGVIMAQIWMRLRNDLANGKAFATAEATMARA